MPKKVAKSRNLRRKTGPPKKRPSKRRPSPSEVREKGDGLERLRVSNPRPRTGPVPTTETENLLNIKWSRYVKHKPTAKQLSGYMLANRREVFYGGALGGGKSDWLAGEQLRFCDLPGYSGVIFRRRLTDLKQPNSLIPRIANWLEPHRAVGECHYSGDEHCWKFKTIYPGTDILGPAAMLQFGYIGEANTRERYLSAEYQCVAFEELANWPQADDYLYMNSRIRKVVCPIHGKDEQGNPIWDSSCYMCNTLKQIPLRMRAASNPGPAWIKRRFRIVPDPTQFKTRQEALVAIQEGQKVKWVGLHPDRPFIPAYLTDNPHLDTEAYQEMLREMSPEERSRLEDGNWEARKDARFKRKWMQGHWVNLYGDHYATLDEMMREVLYYPYSGLLKIFTTVDCAATVKEGPVSEELPTPQKPSSSVISTWGVTTKNSLIHLDCLKFRKEIPDIVEALVENHEKWRPQYNKIEINGVGMGVAQYAMAAGLPVLKNQRKKDKIENSTSAQMLMKNGRVMLATNTPWAEEIEDDIFNWTGLPSEDDDVVDTLADAASELSPRIARDISAPNMKRSLPRAVSTSPKSGDMTIPHYGLG